MTPLSRVWATAIDVLPVDRVVERRDGYLAVRSPGNPTHYFGNFLLFDDAPRAGDAPVWEQLFEDEFADEPRIRHRVLGWDRTDGELGDARIAFVDRGYLLDDSIGLLARPEDVRPHPRENREVEIRALDPSGDDELWRGVLELQAANRDPQHAEESFRAYAGRRLEDYRTHFLHGRGAWYAALDGGGVVASCGIVATGGRGRYQAVDTALSHRSRGIASRLVVAAAGDAGARHGVLELVIAADANYHALGLYESLGFVRSEHVHAVWRLPQANG